MSIFVSFSLNPPNISSLTSDEGQQSSSEKDFPGTCCPSLQFLLASKYDDDGLGHLLVITWFRPWAVRAKHVSRRLQRHGFSTVPCLPRPWAVFTREYFISCPLPRHSIAITFYCSPSLSSTLLCWIVRERQSTLCCHFYWQSQK